MQKPVCFCMLGDERDMCVMSHQTSEEEEVEEEGRRVCGWGLVGWVLEL